MEKPTLKDNDAKFIELIFQEVRKINDRALFDVLYYPTTVTVKIQSNETFRTQIFNKLYHLHRIFGLRFTATQFIKKDKTIISFDLKSSSNI